MSKKTKAMRLALEVLEQWNAPLYKRGVAITALREALAQPEQEPVAWLYTSHSGGIQAFTDEPPPRLKELCKALYVAPQPPVQPGYQALQEAHTRLQKRYGELEAKLREKNT